MALSLEKRAKNGYTQSAENREMKALVSLRGRINNMQCFIVVIGITWLLCMIYTATTLHLHSTDQFNIVRSSTDAKLSNFSAMVNISKNNKEVTLSSLLRTSASLVENGKFHQRMYAAMFKLSQYITSYNNSTFGGSFKMISVNENPPQDKDKYKPPIARGGGLAACLLLKDDNGQLIEWIAYHYHTLPLRYLVVATDPTSITSPLEVLQRWNKTMGMDIQLWDEPVYFPLNVRKDDALKLKNNKTSPMVSHHFYFYFIVILFVI